jgi:hypothetical protein
VDISEHADPLENTLKNEQLGLKKADKMSVKVPFKGKIGKNRELFFKN